MNQITKQIPALFKQTSKRIKRQKNITLTQAQLQSLVSLLKEDLAVEQSILKDARKQASIYWNYCNPTDPTTKEYFYTMNYFKEITKAQKQKIAKLNKLQNTLKKMR